MNCDWQRARSNTLHCTTCDTYKDSADNISICGLNKSSNEQNSMKTDNIEDSQEIDPPISKGLNEVGPRVGNNEGRPLIALQAHGIPRDRCSTCGNTVSVLSWASKCTCD